jgi:hypothetical protein
VTKHGCGKLDAYEKALSDSPVKALKASDCAKFASVVKASEVRPKNQTTRPTERVLQSILVIAAC